MRPLRSLFRKRSALVAAVALGTALVTPLTGARAVAPSQFPTGFGEASTAYTLRFAGVDRYATAGTGAMVSAVDGGTKTGWPFNSGDASNVKTAYGAAACPSSVFIVASDGLPDALAAAALKGLSSITLTGSSHVYNTANALLLLTDTARPPVNGSHLNAVTKTALTQLKGACSGGFDAIVFGGTAAVPAAAETELGAYANAVGRIAGTDRYDTAAQIAALVNSRVSLSPLMYFATASSSGTSEGTPVFLADALTGADALAVAPIAADTHVPILLANAAGLPAATASALASLHPANIVVLGGTGVLPDSVVGAAKSQAGSSNTPIRIAGANRAATSVALAEQLDDIWPANATDSMGNDAGNFKNQLFGFARSEGGGADHVGWPDALSSSLVLSSLSGLATAPTRLAPPVEANNGTTFIGGVKSPHRAPLLLTACGTLGSCPTGTVPLPTDVSAFLTGLYPSATKTASNGASDDGGFGLVFGGANAVAADTELTIAQDLSGGSYKPGAPRTDLSASLSAPKVFYTDLDFSTNHAASSPPNYGTDSSPNGGGLATTSFGLKPGDAGRPKVCAWRGADVGIQWYDLFDPSGGAPKSTATAAYDTGGAPFTAGSNEPFCVDGGTLSTSGVGLFAGVSLSGAPSNAVSLNWSAPSMTLSTTLPSPVATPPSTAPTVGPSPLNGIDEPASPSGATTLALTYNNLPLKVVYKGTTYTSANLVVTITRTSSNSPGTNDAVTCSGTLTEMTGSTAAFVAHFDTPGACEAAKTQNNPAPGPPGGDTLFVAEYTIGAATGAVKFTITGGGSSAPGDTTTPSVSDLAIGGNA